MKTFLVAALAALTLGGCASMREQNGALLGGAAGAVVGGVASDSVGGAVVGGVIGAATGAVIADVTAPHHGRRCHYSDEQGREICRW